MSPQNTWYSSTPCFTSMEAGRLSQVAGSPPQSQIYSRTYANDTANSSNFAGASQSGVCAGPSATALPFDLSPLRFDEDEHSSTSISYPLRSDTLSPLSSGNTSLDDTPQHVWRQTSSVSTATSLSHLILQTSINNVTTFLCGWNNCPHPVGFSQKAQLTTHIRSMHLQEKPFECTTCGTCFSRKQEAIRHVNSMNNGKRYKCSFCRRAFVRRHIRDHHEDNCVMCANGGSSFSGDVVSTHVTTRHD
ncbi:hypothetical protein JB92DRAFT_2929004 [Gautieria morchelliformis]|nr:hypothetical protein JB92DRAFT_2929004 [Gautieria morchelliformis]